ncbi:tRNA(Ile)-lysidine synthase [Grifola frondosa]|uniref:tRNA(Ile)-lysidine synthetase n=1 Tax=Grifola frondosa TaxID=5627 RepID=A0A1C7LSF6_GRIFR|nr:tRNA(Ile)-lysidine synthase [Grifola frondosa]
MCSTVQLGEINFCGKFWRSRLDLLAISHSFFSKNSNGNASLPEDVVSIHVDHDLQKASTSMAEAAATSATALGVQHISSLITWGSGSYPQRPEEGSIESTARLARYHKIQSFMVSNHVPIVAFGHHADDQVETSIMRLLRGSSSMGAAGMRPVRRWGMGGHLGQPWSILGAKGMLNWIVRPLLTVSKDRILATCDANNLHYVNDPTNFQPDLTVRNTIRHVLAEKLNKLNESIQFLRDMSHSSDRQVQLQEGVGRLGLRRDEVDTQVTILLNRIKQQCPPSTLVISCDGFSDVTDPDVRIALGAASSKGGGVQTSTTTLDITSLLKNIWESPTGGGKAIVLYDYRFLVKVDMHQFPKGLADEIFAPDSSATITIEPEAPYMLPKVYLRQADKWDLLLGYVDGLFQVGIRAGGA